VKKRCITKHKFYKKWYTIREHCLNKNSRFYKYYGGKGIKIYDEWLKDPFLFFEYIESLPNSKKENKILKRRNKNKNYEPGNLYWERKFV
jgi:hypothetical protein